MIFVQTVLIPQSAHLQSSAVCRSYSSRPCTSHLLFGPHGCALSFLAGSIHRLVLKDEEIGTLTDTLPLSFLSFVKFFKLLTCVKLILSHGFEELFYAVFVD
ncbi:hypothetical protein Cadr_000009942 [Camelus dromedarius]|uniref:Uncharacterized protein n=1 Tax=Camelus dromedarius TaxID=9838 RepID=A0A5N4DXE9_CAMDR|nr:hypothetical protein Cadr_000009942 [Camelus dromedarius]